MYKVLRFICKKNSNTLDSTKPIQEHGIDAKICSITLQ